MGISSEYSDHSSGEESMKDSKKGEQVTYSFFMLLRLKRWDIILDKIFIWTQFSSTPALSLWSIIDEDASAAVVLRSKIFHKTSCLGINCRSIVLSFIKYFVLLEIFQFSRLSSELSNLREIMYGRGRNWNARRAWLLFYWPLKHACSDNHAEDQFKSGFFGSFVHLCMGIKSPWFRNIFRNIRRK